MGDCMQTGEYAKRGTICIEDIQVMDISQLVLLSMAKVPAVHVRRTTLRTVVASCYTDQGHQETR